MALLGLGNILSLLLIAAHAVTVAVWHRYYRGPGQPFVLRWLASVAVALIVASPVALIASGQAHQVDWIKPPGLVAIIAMAGLIGPQPMFFIVVAVVVIALVTSLVSGRPRLRADWPAGLWGLAVPWLFLPPALLFTVSVIHVTHPLYVFRYIAFCIPAAALLAGTALAALARAAVGWAVAVAALIVIVVAGLGTQGSERLPAGHGYDIRLADQAVASRRAARRRPDERQVLAAVVGRRRGARHGGRVPLRPGPAARHQRSTGPGAVGHPRRHIRTDDRGTPAHGHRHPALGRFLVQGSRAASAAARLHRRLHLAREGRMAALVHPPA